MDGLKTMLVAIDLAERETLRNLEHTYAGVPPAALTVVWIAEWMQAHKLLELVYGENMHIEIVRRASQIPRFLGLQRCLSSSACQMMVESYRGKHESLRTYTLESIVSIAGCAQPEQVRRFCFRLPRYCISQLFHCFCAHFILDCDY